MEWPLFAINLVCTLHIIIQMNLCTGIFDAKLCIVPDMYVACSNSCYFNLSSDISCSSREKVCRYNAKIHIHKQRLSEINLFEVLDAHWKSNWILGRHIYDTYCEGTICEQLCLSAFLLVTINPWMACPLRCHQQRMQLK